MHVSQPVPSGSTADNEPTIKLSRRTSRGWVMAWDSDEEWLRELLEPEPPSKRQRITDDDAEAALFLDELLCSHSSSRVAVPAVVLPTALTAKRDVREVQMIAAPTESSSSVNERIGAASNIQPVLKTELFSSTPGQPMAIKTVVFKLCQSNNAGAILSHATQLIQNIINQGPTVSKIGITGDPAHRWGNDKYGYKRDINTYQQMFVFSEADAAGAAMLEASLINTFRQISGCRNTAPGGESVRSGCPTYTYMVHRLLCTVRAAGG